MDAYERLEATLLAYGGTRVVNAGHDPDAEAVVEGGALTDGADAVLHRLSPSRCHTNAARLFVHGRADTVATGYALSGDGLWRQHSWGVAGGRPVETTIERVAYYGVELSAEQARGFADRELPDYDPDAHESAFGAVERADGYLADLAARHPSDGWPASSAAARDALSDALAWAGERGVGADEVLGRSLAAWADETDAVRFDGEPRAGTEPRGTGEPAARAARAARFGAFLKAHGYGTDPADAATDFVTDLRHWAHQQRVEFSDVVRAPAPAPAGP